MTLSTTLATINPTTGALTANGAGRVKVTATVAADDTYRGATTSHTLAILTPANLAFSSAPELLPTGSDQSCPIQRHPGRDG